MIEFLAFDIVNLIQKEVFIIKRMLSCRQVLLCDIPDIQELRRSF